MSIIRVLKIIENNIEESDFVGKIKVDIVKKTENILGLKFPKSYRMFIENYGCGDIFGIEIFGIISDPITDVQTIPNVLWITNEFKNKGLPKGYIIISETGDDGSYYTINTNIKNDCDENPIYLWNSFNLKESKVYDSFGDFLYDFLKEHV
ncbi:SMI1/KNR4 family protein [Subsaximicrobium wynnwilliamsii]|uniref:SMI1/KNR4 family protein n=1 Tax=Subsaximicrobium wynnwilliamsii TaxID=291179 RepID=A0A5C6ZJN7_9FLAO|nr:SMI1/KNR4 family protein [Subsaximicrobium wynnwilliamsii]TXD83453.1 SMI1/KNR4 family protein [Subsaximicrobium wynnwilliamsii]TXD89272.1 SMI1/KNR4 family protein [Subsaximicrobium wynnwilliamsii]TXE03133.1 SMI1/KNR4 family protein [Subsaximicrobium wynnwilliamsii]